MFKDKSNGTKEEIVQDTLDQFTEHMNLISDGMVNFQKDLGMFARELNMVKAYVSIIIGILEEHGFADKKEMDNIVVEDINEKVKNIQKRFKKHERNLIKETESMQTLAEKLKDSFNEWLDEDGKPIAKA